MRWHIQGNPVEAGQAREALLKAGDEVAARWLSDLFEASEVEPAEEAMVCMDDIAKSEGLVMMVGKRGNRESETALGMALAFSKRVVLIGAPRSDFHHLPTIERYKSLDEFIQMREDEKNAD